VEHLSEIAIDHGGRRIVARRDGDGWTIEEPAAASVPSDLVQAFAVAVLGAEEIERVDGEQHLAAFGLDDRATRVELRPSGGPPAGGGAPGAVGRGGHDPGGPRGVGAPPRHPRGARGGRAAPLLGGADGAFVPPPGGARRYLGGARRRRGGVDLVAKGGVG